MTEREFCVWLEGVFDSLALTSNSTDLEAEQLALIEKRLRRTLAPPEPERPAVRPFFTPTLHRSGPD